jgi:dihydrolipoamide dehydrogenase
MAKKEHFDLIIIGSGPGGYVAAVRAAQLGMKTACVEKHSRLGGVCLNVGCIPSKALLDSSEYFHMAKERFHDHGIDTGQVGFDLETMMNRKDKVIETLTDGIRGLFSRNKVTGIQGVARLAAEDRVEIKKMSDKDEKEIYDADAIILATGSEPIQIPGLEFDGDKIISSTEALSLSSVPKHLGIVGGGYIGLELGSVWRRLGAEVTVIEMLPGIASTLDGQVARRLQKILTGQGLNFQLKTKVIEAKVSKDKVKIKVEKDGKEQSLEFDRLLVAVGRKPLTHGLGLEDIGVKTDNKNGHILVDEKYRTSIPSIYAIGDIIPGPMLAHKASAEGIAAVECLAGLPGEVNYDTIPFIAYTWPEAASVGLTEEQVKERNISYVKGTYPFTGNGRALCMGETEGFVKIIAHKKTNRILGVHILGPRASDMIAECVLAMEFGASAEDLARTVHGHPTLSETIHEAAMILSHQRNKP